MGFVGCCYVSLGEGYRCFVRRRWDMLHSMSRFLMSIYSRRMRLVFGARPDTAPLS